MSSDCPICLDCIEGVSNRVITECGHTFHCSCLMKNASLNGFNCPYCRTSMVPQAPAVVEPVVEHVINQEIQEDDILRGFRMFNDNVNNELHDVVDRQQEQIYQAQMGNTRLLISSEEDREYEYEENNNELDTDKDKNTWYELYEGQSQYRGEWRNGRPNGRGTQEIFEGRNNDGSNRDHSVIEGTFINGKADGYGRQNYDRSEGEIVVPYYEGYFSCGLQHGFGTYYFGNGDYYRGQFKSGCFHGRGIYYKRGINKSYIREYINEVPQRFEVPINGEFVV